MLCLFSRPCLCASCARSRDSWPSSCRHHPDVRHTKRHLSVYCADCIEAASACRESPRSNGGPEIGTELCSVQINAALVFCWFTARPEAGEQPSLGSTSYLARYRIWFSLASMAQTWPERERKRSQRLCCHAQCGSRGTHCTLERTLRFGVGRGKVFHVGR
eukprot:589021-Rhodomonas_salina.1